jgi:hypothetical protein
MSTKNFGHAHQHHLWWQLSLLLVASVISVYMGVALNERLATLMPETKSLSSIFNKRASGLSALFEIASKSGLTCQPWQMPYRELSNTHGLLIVVNPLQSPSSSEIEQILNWVAIGNQLIYFDQFNYPSGKQILKTLDLRRKPGQSVINEALFPVTPSLVFAHVNAIRVSGKSRLSGALPLVSDRQGAFLTQVKWGQGRILLGCAANFCTNQSLQDRAAFDNFQFMVNWLSTAHGSIFFDEKCHGFSKATNLFTFLFWHWPGLVFSQLVLIILVAIASSAQRFGQVKELTRQRNLSNVEFITGLANTYQRAQANLACLEIIGQDFKVQLCKRLSISPHASSSEIVEAWQNCRPKSGSNLGSFLADYERAVDQKKISSQFLKETVSQMDEFAAEMKVLSS